MRKHWTRKITPSENYNVNTVHLRCLHFRDVRILTGGGRAPGFDEYKGGIEET